MKKHWILALILVLTMAVLTGCGCTNSKVNGMDATNMTTVPTTVPTTAPTELATIPSETNTIPMETLLPNATDNIVSTDASDATSGTDATANRSRTIR